MDKAKKKKAKSWRLKAFTSQGCYTNNDYKKYSILCMKSQEKRRFSAPFRTRLRY